MTCGLGAWEYQQRMLTEKLPQKLAIALTDSKLFTKEELGAVTFKRFDGGHHNDIYRVRLGRKDYSVRISKKPNKRAGYFAEEFHNLKIASAAGIAPAVLFADENTGTLIYKYIDGQAVSRDDLADQNFCGTVTRAIKSIHELKEPFLYKHSFLNSIRRRELKYFGPSLDKCPQHIKKLAIAAGRAMELIEANPVAWAPCHADLILDNMLRVKRRVVIIDWELSGMSDPHEDLANFIVFGLMTKKSIDMILMQYFHSLTDIGAARTLLYVVIILYYWILRHAEDLLKIPDSERLLQKQQRRLSEAYSLMRTEDYRSAVIALRRHIGKEYKSEQKSMKSEKRAPTLKRAQPSPEKERKSKSDSDS